jgi:hypothetical protein
LLPSESCSRRSDARTQLAHWTWPVRSSFYSTIYLLFITCPIPVKYPGEVRVDDIKGLWVNSEWMDKEPISETSKHKLYSPLTWNLIQKLKTLYSLP